MGRRTLPVLLVTLAVLADTAGAHSLAKDAVFAALPFASVAALVTFGDFVDMRARLAAMHSLLYALIVALLVLSCAARSSAVQGVPPLAVSSLLAAAGLFAVKAALTVVPYRRRPGSFSPVKP